MARPQSRQWKRRRNGFASDALCVYGSHYPYWTFEPPEAAAERLPASARERVMGANAIDLYTTTLESA